MKIAFKDRALNLLFPPVCGMCENFDKAYICEKCYADIKKYERNIIEYHNDKYFEKNMWIFKYSDKVRSKIIDYKFNDKSYLHRTFAEIISRNSDVIKYIEAADYIVPVPIHRKRYKLRGYNQCCLLAKQIADFCKNIKYRNDFLIKIKNTAAQSTLDKANRANNIKNVFIVKNKEQLKNKKVLLIDDVYTTGSTVNECAKVLKQAGSESVYILTLAKD